jgi:hypothetical protein
MVVRRPSVHRVGSFDPATGTVTLTDPERLAAWLDVDEIDEAELNVTR